MKEHKPLTEQEVSYCESINDYEDAVKSAVMGMYDKKEKSSSRSGKTARQLDIEYWFPLFFEAVPSDKGKGEEEYRIGIKALPSDKGKGK